MKHIIKLLLLGLFITLFAACDDEAPDCTDFTNPLCSNYNPCHDQQATSADFQTACVVVSNANRTITSVEDTFYVGTSIVFTALQEDALSYEWKIGDDNKTFTEKSFSLYFNLSDSVALFNRAFPIRLIVTRTPNTDCFPTDNGIDTLTKYIYFVSMHEAAHKNFLGTWVGSLEAKPNEIYEIEISDKPEIDSPSGIPAYYNLKFKNFDNEGNGTCLYLSSGGMLYNNFYTSSLTIPNFADCQRVNVASPLGVYGNIDEAGNLRIEWTQSLAPDYEESVKRIFNGRRK